MTYAERARLRETSIIVAVFAIPAILLFPGIHLNTPFTASLRSTCIRFTTAPWTTSPGLFSFDDIPLRLTIDDFERMELSDPSHRSVFKSGTPVKLEGVRLTKLDMSQPLRVFLEAGADGGVNLTLERLRTSPNDLALVRVDAESKLPSDMPACGSKWSCEWAVYSKGNGLRLTLRPIKGTLRVESNIPLLDGTAITFTRDNGQSAIVAPASAQLTAMDRKLSLRQPVAFGGLKATFIESLAPDGAGIKLAINQGSSDLILMGESNEAATLAEFIAGHRSFSAYLSMVALIGSTVLTILTRLKLLKKA